MTPLCACGCGKPLTMSMYWASDTCYRTWASRARNTEQLPDDPLVPAPPARDAGEGPRAWAEALRPITDATAPELDAAFPQVASQPGWLIRALDALYGRTP